MENLEVNTPYKVTCTIQNNDDPNATLLFEPRLLPASTYGNVKLNNHPLPGNSDALQYGNNQLSFQMAITEPDSEKYNQFSLSSTMDAPFHIDSCIARVEPTSQNSAKATQAVSANSDWGFFYAYNNTEHVVTMGVGNFFPTPYVIQPNSWRFVTVSTNNQDIRITNIE